MQKKGSGGMLQFFKYLQGYLTIKVWGYSPERFMNLCSNRNILLWNVQQYEAYYIMNISVKGFLKLRPVVRKTRTRVAILQRYGLPFFVPKIKKRFIFTVGLTGCLLFLMLMMNYIWSIEVVGNVMITEEEFMDFLLEYGVDYGTPKRHIDIEGLEKEIRIHYDNITWDSVKLQGTKLYIQIKENTLLQVDKKQKPIGKASDLIASRDGTIVSMITRKGVPNVKIGMDIKKGDMLVSGLIPIVGEDSQIKKYQYCNADADIYVRCKYAYQDKLPLSYQDKVFTGREKKLFFVKIMNREWQMPFVKIPYEQYDMYSDMKQFKILDHYYLPIYCGTKTIREYQYQKKKYTKQEAKERIENNFHKFLASLREKGVQIIEKDVKMINKMDSIQVIGTVQVIERTGEQMASIIPQIENNNSKEEAEYAGE